MLFLSIETSADACSVSLIGDDVSGDPVVRSLDADEPRSHARMLVPLIEELLAHAEAPIGGVCVDHGPGSYTGLRIGVSTAKGLAWSLGCPLHAVSSLELLAAGFLELNGEAGNILIRPIISARNREAFTALYESTAEGLQEREAPHVVDIDDPSLSASRDTILVTAGHDTAWTEESGLQGPVCPILLHSSLAAPLLRNQSERYRVEAVSTFEPLYLRAFVARKPAKSIFDRLPF